MNERTALMLVFAAMVVAIAITFAAVRLLGGPDGLVAVIYVMVLGVGADTCSRVSLHYLRKPPAQRRRQR
jgi:hypothetical protein